MRIVMPRRPRFLPAGGVALVVMCLAAVLVVSPGAGAQEAREALPDSLPSFGESPGCGALGGIRGPLAAQPGLIPLSAPIYGPWGDFYGRTVQDVWDQQVIAQLPGMSPGSKALYVHERVLPAFQEVLDNLRILGAGCSLEVRQSVEILRGHA